MGISGVSLSAAPWWRRLIVAVLAPSFGVGLLAALPPLKVGAAACDVPTSIACENTQPGSPSSEWNITGSGSASIQGFAADISVNRGTTSVSK